MLNISETIAGDRSNQFELLTEYKFCRKSLRSISINNRFCNRFINLGRPIFSLNHSGASAAMVFAIPTTFGIAHAPCYTCDERATQSAARRGSSLFDFCTVPPTHYVPKIVFTFTPICRACKNSIAIYSIIMRDLFFSLHRPAPAIGHWHGGWTTFHGKCPMYDLDTLDLRSL